MKSGIYSIRNIINEKKYIGYTKDFNSRKIDHFSNLKCNKHNNKHLQGSYNKYGKSCFVFEIIEECEEQFLIKREHFWITSLNLRDRKYGYNIAETDPDKKMISRALLSEERKKHLSILNKGKKLTQEAIERLRQVNKGRKMTTESKLKISSAKKGIRRSLETKENISKSKIGKKHSEETKLKMSIKASGRTPWNKGARYSEGYKNGRDKDKICYRNM